MKYKIGDRVRITRDKSKGTHWNVNGEMDKWLGKVMTIRATARATSCDVYLMKEDFGEFLGVGWLWTDDMIDGLADEHKTVITTDGKTTTAKLYDGKKFIKEATAKCSPEDEFDFKTGAELAFERLFDKNKGEYFTGKAVYTGGGFLTIGRTIGKIYEFKKGFYYDDDSIKRPAGDKGFTKANVYSDGFLPIKE